MATWNDLNEGNATLECSVCYVPVLKKRRSKHLTQCLAKYERSLSERGLIQCPLSNLHVVPKRYLNHHLDGNCDQAMNLLRPLFQRNTKLRRMPAHFLCDVPDDLLNQQNKLLLYTLQRDLEGNILTFNKELYPDEEEEEERQEQRQQQPGENGLEQLERPESPKYLTY